MAVSNEASADHDRALEEYKILAEERRFVSTRYMQGMVLYLVFVGFGLKELLSIESQTLAFMVVALLSAVNALAVYGSVFFRNMAVHATKRARELATALGMQPPHSLLGGFWFGIVGVAMVQVVLVVILLMN